LAFPLRPLIHICLFASGFCALVYQTAWLRDFRLIFGTSTAASAAVLGIFLGGLGVGSLLLGARADKQARPLALYALLESMIALSAALVPLLLVVVRDLYIASGGVAVLGTPLATVLRLLLGAMVLTVPTLAMGGTLPAIVRAVRRTPDSARHEIALAYGLNTLGAVVGCLAATFWALEQFGTHATVWAAAALNAIVAAVAWSVSRGWPPVPPRADIESTPGHVLAGRGSPHWLLLTVSAATGFVFLLMELVWYRMLAPLLGGSVYTFGLVLAAALAGIGIGSLLYASRSTRAATSLSALGWTCALEAGAIAVTYAAGDRIALFAAMLSPLGSNSFTATVAGWTLVASLVVLAPAVIAGYQFPLLIGLIERLSERVGAHVGQVYAANTAGALCGSLAGGFGLLPWLTAAGAWRAAAMLLLVLAGVVGITGARIDGAASRRSILATCAMIAVTLACLAAAGPTAVWRHSGIGAGLAPAAETLRNRNELLDWSSMVRRNTVWQGDGTESGVALFRAQTGYSLIMNGKSDGNARSDAGTQIMLGLLGALSHPDPQRALVIGLGTGTTAGWLGAIPGIQRVEVVELEPRVVTLARDFGPVNRDVIGNPEVTIRIGDAREALMTSREQYDLIASEPSNPYRAGIASLFTREFYRAAAERLSDDGVFVQWVQAYGIDAATLHTIYATLGAVFPQVETWQTNPGDLVLVAHKQPSTYHLMELSQRISEEPYRSGLLNGWSVSDVTGLLGHHLANDQFTRRLAALPAVAINTDDRNIIEFQLARSLRLNTDIPSAIRAEAQLAGSGRLPLDRETEIDWSAVETAWVGYAATAGIDASTVAFGVEQIRRKALVQYYVSRNVRGAFESWQQLPDAARVPRDVTELTMVAALAATTGEEDATLAIEALRAYRPGDADVILAALRLQQRRHEDAAVALAAAFLRFRGDPWASSPAIVRALQLAIAIGDTNMSLARRLYDALSEPFAVRAYEDGRLALRLALTQRLDFPALCRAAVAPFEPHVPTEESFLRARRDCYQVTNDTSLTRADAELRQFLEKRPTPLLFPF
jgi:spermidine synthase